MAAEYDVFVSHAWADGDRPQQIAAALSASGLRVWFDASEISDFASITRAVTEGLVRSKALLAYYSKTYPLRRACQWELTTAFLAAQTARNERGRVLVINPEPTADHIHPVELRDAKFRNAPGGDGAALQELVQAVVKHVAAIDGPLADIHPLTAPIWYGMKSGGSTRFVGRLKEMWEVHSLLHGGDVAQVTGATAVGGGIGQIRGLGGIGKSLLAEEYALRFGAAYPGGVFWLRAYGNDDASKAGLGPEQREVMRVDQLRTFAEQLLHIETRGHSAKQIEGALADKIASGGKPCLWVVDDVPDGLDDEALRCWFAPHAFARTLLTTRSGEYGSRAKAVDLSGLRAKEALQLLTSSRVPRGETEEEQASKLARELGYHALALDVAGSALKNYGTAPFGTFLDELGNPDEDTLELAKDLADALPNGHEASIAQTMLSSLRKLGPDGQDFMRLASMLGNAPIPANLVSAAFEKADGVKRSRAESRQRKAFSEVTKASLADVAGESEHARSVHTLVSRAIRFDDQSTPGRSQALRAAAVAVMGVEIGKTAPDARRHKAIEFHVAHARHIVDAQDPAEAPLMAPLAQYDLARGSYASAKILYERLLELCRETLGDDHPFTLASMNNVAITLLRLGDLAGARKLQEDTLAISRRVLGREHADTVVSMHNLAMTLKDQGELRAARELEESALAVQSRTLGSDDPRTLISATQLAQIDWLQGRTAEARARQEETLAISRRVLGADHEDTLVLMNDLGVTLSAQGDHAAARRLKEETLAARRRLLAPEHPSTLQSMSNLAVTLGALGELDSARKLHEEALDIKRRVLGPEHRETLISLKNLVDTLEKQGDFGGVRGVLEETLDIRRRVLGPEHPVTCISAWNLLSLLVQLNDRNAAAAVLQRDLRWLLDRDPSTLGADQRTIRQLVADASTWLAPTP